MNCMPPWPMTSPRCVVLVWGPLEVGTCEAILLILLLAVRLIQHPTSLSGLIRFVTAVAGVVVFYLVKVSLPLEGPLLCRDNSNGCLWRLAEVGLASPLRVEYPLVEKIS
jgi:hypothetical protein